MQFVSPRVPAWDWPPERRNAPFELKFKGDVFSRGLFSNEEHARELAATLLAGIPTELDFVAKWELYGEDLGFDVDTRLFQFGRIFYENRGFRTVHHAAFELPDLFHEKGHGAAMLRASLHAYDALGVSRITLYARRPIGSYVWARLGCSLRRSDVPEWRRLLEEAANDRGLSAKARRALRDVAKHSTDAKLLYDVSRLSDGKTPFGKLILMDRGWTGYCNLIDPEHREALKEALAR